MHQQNILRFRRMAMSSQEYELQFLLSRRGELETVVKGQDLDELVKLFEGYRLISADLKYKIPFPRV